MQTFKHEKNLSSLLLLKTVQRESRFPDSWSLYMSQEVERSEEETDSTHQEGNPVPRGGKVAGLVPRTWRTSDMIPAVMSQCIPKVMTQSHIICIYKTAYLSSHSSWLNEKGSLVKMLLRDQDPPTRIAKVWLTTPNVDEDVEQLELSYICGRGAKCYNHFGKLFASFL